MGAMLKLLTLLGTLGASVTAWLAASMSRKAVVAFSVVSAFVVVVAAFLACMKIIIAGVISLSVFPVWIQSWIGMFIPSNYGGVIASVMAAKTCKAAYNLAVEKVKMIGQSS